MGLRGFLGSSVLMACGAAYGQATAQPHEATTWDLFGGGSYARLANVTNASGNVLERNASGWDISVSERPYVSAPWFGGTIEGSGAYSTASYTTSTVPATSNKESQNIYTFMGGPMVAVQRGRVEPFAHVLLGVLYTNTATTGATTSSTKVKNFGYALGGGLDFLVKPSWAVRVQGDWLRSGQTDTTSGATVRASVGGVYKF